MSKKGLKNREVEKTTFSSIMVIYLVLLLGLSIPFLALLGIVFFHGILEYGYWILIAGLLMICGLILFRHHLFKKGVSLMEQGKEVHISLLNGFITIYYSGKDKPGLTDPDRVVKYLSHKTKNFPNGRYRPIVIPDKGNLISGGLEYLAYLKDNGVINEDEFSRIENRLLY